MACRESRMGDAGPLLTCSPLLAKSSGRTSATSSAPQGTTPRIPSTASASNNADRADGVRPSSVMVDQVRGHTLSASDRVEVEEDSDATGEAERESSTLERESPASEEAAGKTSSTEWEGRKFAITAGRLESVAVIVVYLLANSLGFRWREELRWAESKTGCILYCLHKNRRT